MKNKLIENNLHLIVFFFLYLTVLLGLYFNEDNLGGAMEDATLHFKYSQKFNENFYQTLLNFGNVEDSLYTRNSPIFWIFLSLFDKFISYETIRVLNTSLVFFIAVIFYKSLVLKFKYLDPKTLIVLTSFIFLSPSLRSLAIWPYSLIWGLLFFNISVYYYLKFKANLNFKKSLIILLNIIISSYIYPAFSVFYIFFFYEIIQKVKNKNRIVELVFLSFILSIPCLIYIVSKDFFTSYQSAQGMNDLSLKQSLNISNKILIISTICLYFLLPIINLKEIYLKIKKSNKGNIFILLIFCSINFYFFNFPHSVWGGGFFHKFSNVLFDNNILFFLSSFISVLIIYLMLEKKLNNYLLLLILILYNPQFTIYLKYFDPLVFILFLTLFDFNLKKHFVKKSYAIAQFYGVIIFYYCAIFAKNNLL